MGQRDSHPGKQGQRGPSVHLGSRPTSLPCRGPALLVSAGLQCVWLPPPLSHHHLVTSFPLLFQRGDECFQDRRAEGRKCCPALHRAQACPVRRLHMVVPGCFLVTLLPQESCWGCVGEAASFTQPLNPRWSPHQQLQCSGADSKLALRSVDTPQRLSVRRHCS